MGLLETVREARNIQVRRDRSAKKEGHDLARDPVVRALFEYQSIQCNYERGSRRRDIRQRYGPIRVQHIWIVVGEVQSRSRPRGPGWSGQADGALRTLGAGRSLSTSGPLRSGRSGRPRAASWPRRSPRTRASRARNHRQATVQQGEPAAELDAAQIVKRKRGIERWNIHESTGRDRGNRVTGRIAGDRVCHVQPDVVVAQAGGQRARHGCDDTV